jgi:hypothetical protein
MRTVTVRSCFFLCTIALALAVTALADDQEKATTEIKRITSISVDANMRSIVNRTMADMLKVSRLDLVKQRQELNLNYGALFLAHQLTAGGAKMEDIAAQLKAGQKISDIANASHANWRQISSEAKKLNKKIDESIEKYFTDTKKQSALNQADYDAKADKVPADSDISKDEYADAQNRYQHLHDLANEQLPTGDANTRNSGAGAGAPGAVCCATTATWGAK